MLMCISFIIHSPTYIFFFFNDTATTEIYTLSLHDALPILSRNPNGGGQRRQRRPFWVCAAALGDDAAEGDRKSTRLNSSHLVISYAVFCLKKKKTNVLSHSCDPTKIAAYALFTGKRIETQV